MVLRRPLEGSSIGVKIRVYKKSGLRKTSLIKKEYYKKLVDKKSWFFLIIIKKSWLIKKLVDKKIYVHKKVGESKI